MPSTTEAAPVEPKEEMEKLLHTNDKGQLSFSTTRSNEPPIGDSDDTPVLFNSALHNAQHPMIRPKSTLSISSLLLPHKLSRQTTKEEFLAGPKLKSTYNPIVHSNDCQIKQEEEERFKIRPITDKLNIKLDNASRMCDEIGEVTKKHLKKNDEDENDAQDDVSNNNDNDGDSQNNEKNKESTTERSWYARCHKMVVKEVKGNIKEIQRLAGIVTNLAEKTGIQEGINGYRSLLILADRVVHLLLSVLADCPVTMPTFQLLFQWPFTLYWENDMRTMSKQLTVIKFILATAIRLSARTVDLFVDHEQLQQDEEEILNSASKTVPLESFYGHKFGPQYPVAVQHMLHLVVVANASYNSTARISRLPLLRVPVSVFNGIFYGYLSRNSEKFISENTAVEITKLKAFWNLTEGLWNEVVTAMTIPVLTDVAIELPPKSFEVERTDGQTLRVLPPSLPPYLQEERGLATPLLTTSIRYISNLDYDVRKLKDYIKEENLERRFWTFVGNHLRTKKKHSKEGNEMSNLLIIHFHGGGFVSQTAASHGLYLRQWAKNTNAPIVSVNYRLAPEYPFPIAFQECFYSYMWALENCEKLGSTAEKVIVVGDSAGGNLAAAVVVRAITERVRVPDSIIMMYPALYMLFVPSPSRLLSLVDGLLPFDTLKNCFDAYLPKYAENVDPLTNPFLSPACASDEILKKFPDKIYVMAGTLDPLMDDTIWMTKRLVAVGRNVRLKIYDDLPHGFLNFGAVPGLGTEMWNAVLQASEWMTEVFNSTD